MYKREYKVCGEYPHIDHKDKNMNTFQPSLVTSFYKEESVSMETGEAIVEYHDPIYMLFNQERLSRLGSGAVELWFNQMNQSRNNPLADLRKECSDEDLVTMIKSRHLQSPSEILSWSRLMLAKMDEFKSEVSKLVAEKLVSEKQAEHDKTDVKSEVKTDVNNVPNVQSKTE